MQAHEFLLTASSALEDRAKLRDSEGGERSMARTVAAFNAARCQNLSEEDGWAFMVLLKLVRSSQGKFHADDYVDGAAYFGLLGESSQKERPIKNESFNHPVKVDSEGRNHYGVTIQTGKVPF